MKNIKINDKNLLSYNRKELIKQIQEYSKISNIQNLDKEMNVCYDDISNVFLLLSNVGWNYFKQFSLIHHIKTINFKDYNKLSLKKIEELIFNWEV
jgi:hypothetical protein